ncbi:hypothetical protein B0A55_11893, partial [Friedmanniomyces simplex]
QKMDQYSIQPQNCYNMDEKGFLVGHLQKVKRIFPKALMQQQRLLGTEAALWGGGGAIEDFKSNEVMHITKRVRLEESQQQDATTLANLLGLKTPRGKKKTEMIAMLFGRYEDLFSSSSICGPA